MAFEAYWKTQPKTLDQEINELIQQVAEHAWNRATEATEKEFKNALLLRRIQLINATPSKSSILREAISQNTSHGVW